MKRLPIILVLLLPLLALVGVKQGESSGVVNAYRYAEAGGSYVLDTYSTNIYSAYSVRLLRSAYSGNCVRVREDGGDTETDIGFSSDWIDTAAISSHCGTNNGYVVKWYDQSGNSRDVSHATAAKQPQIFDGTSVLTASNGKAVLSFDGTDDELIYTEADAGNTDHSDYAAVNNVTFASGRFLYSGAHFGSGQSFKFETINTSSAIQLRHDWSTGTKLTFSTGDPENTEWLISIRRNYSGATAQMIVNNSAETTASSIGTARHEGVLLARRYNYNSSHADCEFQEFIRWHVDFLDADDTTIRGDQNTAFSYY